MGHTRKYLTIVFFKLMYRFTDFQWSHMYKFFFFHTIGWIFVRCIPLDGWPNEWYFFADLIATKTSLEERGDIELSERDNWYAARAILYYKVMDNFSYTLGFSFKTNKRVSVIEIIKKIKGETMDEQRLQPRPDLWKADHQQPFPLFEQTEKYLTAKKLMMKKFVEDLKIQLLGMSPAEQCPLNGQLRHGRQDTWSSCSFIQELWNVWSTGAPIPPKPRKSPPSKGRPGS